MNDMIISQLLQKLGFINIAFVLIFHQRKFLGNQYIVELGDAIQILLHPYHWFES